MPTELDEILTRLQDSDPDVRANAIDEISTLNPPQALQMILPFLVDEDASVRESAAFNLGDIRDDQAIAHLIKVFKEDEDEEVRFYALRALRAYRSPEILRCLVEEAYYGQASRSLREEVAHQLGKYNEDEALQALISLLRTDDTHVIIATVDSLQNLNRPRLGSIWETILQEYFHPYICKIAAKSLSELKSTTLFDLVLTWSQSHDYKKRRAAAYLLGDAQAINDEKAIPYLMRLALRDPAQSVREMAIAALAQYHDPQIGAYLRQLTREPNLSEFVRESIAEQLASYNGSETISALNNLLEDESSTVRSTAEASLFILNPHVNGKVPVLLDALTQPR